MREEDGRTLPPQSNHAMQLQANFLLKNAGRKQSGECKAGIELGDNGSVIPKPKKR
jgi:hypothetical protein